MSEKQIDKPSPEVERYALELYSARSAMRVVRSAGSLMLQCLQEARECLKTLELARKGELEIVEPSGPQLDDASCPNQPENHPHNLVSKRFGNLDDVRRLNALVQKHDVSLEGFTPFFDKKLGIKWDLQHTRLARHLFPMYCAAEAN